MKALTIITYVGAAGIAVLGLIMAKTNPEQVEYEDYAVERLSKYLKNDVCIKTPHLLDKFVSFNCGQLVDSANPEIRKIITETTERQDYLVFSVYRTDLKLNSWIPGYRFETVGAFDKFYTYTAEKQ
jgi:hypothetical protein